MKSACLLIEGLHYSRQLLWWLQAVHFECWTTCGCGTGRECQNVKSELQVEQRGLYLLLATGRAISNLARNWKYCSLFCWVKPVPTSSIWIQMQTGNTAVRTSSKLDPNFMSVCWKQKDSDRYEQILMTFSRNVENGPRNRWLRFGDVLDSGGTLTLEHSKITGQDQGATGPGELRLLLPKLWMEVTVYVEITSFTYLLIFSQ